MGAYNLPIVLKRLFTAGLLILWLVLPAKAFDVPAPEGFVTDKAGVLSEAEKGMIAVEIGRIEKETTAEIGILIIDTTGGDDIAEVAFEVGNTWGVGKEENDNGLVIVIAVEDRDWFMATGYGLEGALPDAIVKRIGEAKFPSHFRNSMYASGIMTALSDIEMYIKEDPGVLAYYSSDAGMDFLDFQGDIDKEMNEVFIAMIIMAIAFGKTFWIALSKNKIWNSLVLNFIIGLAAAALLPIYYMFVILGMSALFDFAAIVGGSGGGSGGYSGGSSSGGWSSSSGSSWSSGSSGGSFGGGSFGGGGSGGSW